LADTGADRVRSASVSDSNESALRRELGWAVAAAVVVNATIGTGIFKKPAEVVRQTGSLEASFVVWVVGAAVAFAGALCFAELAAAMPRTGGIYEYLRRAYGPRFAFLYGWAKITLLLPSAVGSFALLAAESLAAIFDLPESGLRDSLIAIAVILSCAFANALGVRASAVQQAVVTAVKYLGLLFLACIGLLAPLAPDREVPLPAEPPAFNTEFTFTGLFAGLVAAMWAYDGWADLSSLSGEVKNPGKNLPRALLAGTAAVGIVYLLANLGYERVLGLEGLRRSTTGSSMAAAHVATLTIGATGRVALFGLVLVSCLGGCMASLLTNSRTFVPMATDGVFIRWLGRVYVKTGVPTNAIAIGAVLGCICVSWQSFEELTNAFVVGYFPFYAAAVIAIFVFRKKLPELPRPFRMPLYPIPAIVFLIGALWVMLGAITSLEPSSIVAGLVIAAGIPISFIWMPLRARDDN
jgi:APA family basic amino acid/polyamine antiporter